MDISFNSTVELLDSPARFSLLREWGHRQQMDGLFGAVGRTLPASHAARDIYLGTVRYRDGPRRAYLRAYAAPHAPVFVNECLQVWRHSRPDPSHAPVQRAKPGFKGGCPGLQVSDLEISIHLAW